MQQTIQQPVPQRTIIIKTPQKDAKKPVKQSSYDDAPGTNIKVNVRTPSPDLHRLPSGQFFIPGQSRVYDHARDVHYDHLMPPEHIGLHTGLPLPDALISRSTQMCGSRDPVPVGKLINIKHYSGNVNDREKYEADNSDSDSGLEYSHLSLFGRKKSNCSQFEYYAVPPNSTDLSKFDVDNKNKELFDKDVTQLQDLKGYYVVSLYKNALPRLFGYD